MTDVLLIGGGRDRDDVAASHAPFLALARGPIALLTAGEVDEARWQAQLGGRARLHRLEDGPPRLGDDVTGVYVAGGDTPAYAGLLRGWAPPPGLPYAGFSAGAAVAAAQAVVGGWLAADGAAVCPEDAAEGLEPVTVVPGLGLVPFAVDVHAAQWGTLGRLVHAVDAGLVERGVAIDEGTCVHVRGDDVAVVGTGAAWFVTPGRVVRRRGT